MNSSFRVLSLNCKNEIYRNPFLKDHSLELRKERILAYLSDIQPLCVGLQEFTDDMKEAILPRLSHYEVFGEYRSLSNNRFNEQTAILVNTSLAKLQGAKTIWLSDSQEKHTRLLSSLLPRTCTVAEIELQPNKQRFRLFNVHLDVALPYTRYRQAKILLDIIGAHYQTSPLPFVIVGDFNAHYDSKTIALFRNNLHSYPFTLTDIYANSLAVHQPTLHQFRKQLKQTSPIDYIFVSQGIEIEGFAIVSDVELPLSDHYPILAEVAMKKR